MSEKEYESRSAREIFRDAGGFIGERGGIDVLYKVADEYEEFVEALQAKGLGVLATPWASGDIFGIIMNGSEGLDFPFHYYKDEKGRGVWISDIDWYKRLMEVAEE